MTINVDLILIIEGSVCQYLVNDALNVPAEVSLSPVFLTTFALTGIIFTLQIVIELKRFSARREDERADNLARDNDIKFFAEISVQIFHFFPNRVFNIGVGCGLEYR